MSERAYILRCKCGELNFRNIQPSSNYQGWSYPRCSKCKGVLKIKLHHNGDVAATGGTLRGVHIVPKEVSQVVVQIDNKVATPDGKQPSALSVQQGGDHYKKLKIQPVEYIHANNIPFAEGSVIKYVTRWRDKNGIADLEKAKHFIELLIELETKAAADKTPDPS